MLSEYQKHIILEMGKNNFYLVENSSGCFLETKDGNRVKKINKRSLVSLLKNEFLIKLKSNTTNSVYGLSNKSLTLFSTNNSLDINKFLSNYDFKVHEMPLLDKMFSSEFSKLYHLKDVQKYYVAVYKFSKTKSYIIIIAKDKNGTYHIGTKDSYNKILNPYDKVDNDKALKSYLSIITDIIMESEMDSELDLY